LSSSIDLHKNSEEEKVVKFSWKIKNFVQKINNCKDQDDGVNSKDINIKLNDFNTTWNTSIRLWKNEKGDPITNQFLFCLNLASVSGNANIANLANASNVGVNFRLRVPGLEIGQLDTCVSLASDQSLQCVAATNVVINDDFCHNNRDVAFHVRLSFHLGSNLQQEKYLGDLWESSDMMIVCGKRNYLAHKDKLCQESPVIKSMLGSISSEVTNETQVMGDVNNNARDRIILDNVDEAVLLKILYFVYTGFVEFEDDCVELLLAANLYQISSLKYKCETHLVGQISPSLVSSYLLIAQLTNCKQLKQTALKYCKMYKEYIFKDETWTKIEEELPDLYEEVLSLISPQTCSTHVQCVQDSNRYRDMMSRRVDEEWQSTNSFHVHLMC